MTNFREKRKKLSFLAVFQSPPTTDSPHRRFTILCRWFLYSVGIYVCIIIMYLHAAVGTVFEIATSPLAIILHSRPIKNGFFSFWKFCQKRKKISKKTPKMIIFPVFCHNLSSNRLRNMILVSTNMFSGIGNRMRAISKPPDNRVARLRITGFPNLRISP